MDKKYYVLVRQKGDNWVTLQPVMYGEEDPSKMEDFKMDLELAKRARKGLEAYDYEVFFLEDSPRQPHVFLTEEILKRVKS
ncbi:MAG: hypothetical protein ABIH37_05830 [archaeon]